MHAAIRTHDLRNDSQGTSHLANTVIMSQNYMVIFIEVSRYVSNLKLSSLEKFESTRDMKHFIATMLHGVWQRA